MELLEDILVESEHFERLLDAKLDPVIKTIDRLEKQQEKIVDLIANQAAMMNTITHLEITVKDYTSENTKIHDTLFEKIREIEKNSNNKLWDIIKLVIAVLLGGFIGKKI